MLTIKFLNSIDSLKIFYDTLLTLKYSCKVTNRKRLKLSALNDYSKDPKNVFCLQVLHHGYSLMHCPEKLNSVIKVVKKKLLV